MKLPIVATFLAAAGVSLAQPALTIYNQHFAVVREIVPLDLHPGINDVRFSGVTGQVEPDSVVLRDPLGKTALPILEQGYRSDAISEGLLLSFYEGKSITFIAKDQTGHETKSVGQIVRSGYVPGSPMAVSPIIKVNGDLQFSLPGEPRFPALADDSVLRPTLSWKIRAEQSENLNAELGYISEGFSWSASYNLVAPEKGDRLDVVGWVTLSNSSGKTFENAAIKLMAGDVAKLRPVVRPEPSSTRMGGSMEFGIEVEKAVTEKAFDEFHLYTIGRPVTLRDGETKQVEFMNAGSVLTPTVYVYDGANYRGARRPRDFGPNGNTKVWVMREFKNSEENHLGMPLPAGRIRLYRRDESDGRLEFVGEDEIDHTPKNETLRFYTGDSFDLVGERRQTSSSGAGLSSVSRKGPREATESFEIKLRNRKSGPVEIRIVEHLRTGGGITSEISDKSAEFTKTNASTIEFRVTVNPDQEQVVSYTVHYSGL